MKSTIHPTWYKNAKVVCACGNTFTIGSTVPEIRVEICSNCHPFYTGTQKLVDTQGQVERFLSRTKSSEIKKVERAKIEESRKQRVQKQATDKPSLKDLLMATRRNKQA